VFGDAGRPSADAEPVDLNAAKRQLDGQSLACSGDVMTNSPTAYRWTAPLRAARSAQTQSSGAGSAPGRSALTRLPFEHARLWLAPGPFRWGAGLDQLDLELGLVWWHVAFDDGARRHLQPGAHYVGMHGQVRNAAIH